MAKCAFCQKEVPVLGRVGRCDVCPSCDHDLHCCYQCQFYDAKAHRECREPQAEYVSDKEKANFCDYFVFDPQIQVKTADKEAQKAKFESLFKKSK